MLASLLHRARHWLYQGGPQDDALPLCVPEWSEAMAEHQSAIWWKVKPYTMTSVERVVALCQTIAYVENHQIPGAIVECGVWKGGSMMAAALALQALASTQRQLYLFDTYLGMTPPAPIDIDWQGRSARELLHLPGAEAEQIRAQCSLAKVKQAMLATRYPWEKLVFVQGKVEKSIPREAPEQIAVLRLDTDWYQSTLHELEHLYPRLAVGGVLILDDYGYWQGAKRAVDQYFRDQSMEPDLRTIDFAGRLMVKPATPTALPRAA